MRTILTAAVLLAAVISCDASDGSPVATDTTDGMAIDTCGVEPTFTNVQEVVFQPHCSFGSCHGTVSAKGNLLLTREDAFVSLKAPVDNDGTALTQRVAPGDPAASFVVRKMQGLLNEGEGDLMPKGRPMPLDDCTVDLVRGWIAAGAENN